MEYNEFKRLLEVFFHSKSTHNPLSIDEERFLCNQFNEYVRKCGLFINAEHEIVPMHGGLMGTIYHETRPNIEVKSKGHLAEGVVMTEGDIINLIGTFCNILEFSRGKK
jgi:hypothetical protein